MKKTVTTASLSILAAFALTACNAGADSLDETTDYSPDNPVSVKIGVTGTDTPQWDFIADIAAEEGIEIEIVRFNDYVQPNQALADGEIDANAFQTISYFDHFIEEHNLDLTAIGSTVLAPMGLYSTKYDSVDDIPDGAEITIDKEATNQARNLMLLQEAGLLELEDDFGVTSGVDQIKNNPKNIKLTEIVAGNAPRLMEDVDAALINNGIAVDAGLVPPEDAIALESETATPYINIIAARSEDADNPVLQRIVDIYQSDEVKTFIEEEYAGATIPTYISLDELNSYPR
ncbi:MetQ/NlpA family ABC transporter substrate-binding protein [Shouchella clausii]|uniref:MetQ/NlpA family ABC transporter substrate-binding protein n=1 Tax=Shouchella clausii TaxID=79880 RepID=UPI000BA60C12|nr:MetQ/NlpA family ABC transporter substrate-binding protein [Shouchella clausii]PAD16431.1 methionine ABC transporter substrate-binding protein [Shouchella clausii]PAF08986.1 methionine ABC transporter substrate-binding protein [Shouchella clausii]